MLSAESCFGASKTPSPVQIRINQKHGHKMFKKRRNKQSYSWSKQSSLIFYYFVLMLLVSLNLQWRWSFKNSETLPADNNFIWKFYILYGNMCFWLYSFLIIQYIIMKFKPSTLINRLSFFFFFILN